MDTPTIMAALGALFTALGVFMATRHVDLKRIDEDIKEKITDCAKLRHPQNRDILELKDSMREHHEDTGIHRDPDREEAQHRRLEQKIDSNKDSIEARIIALQTLMENVLREVRYNNGTHRK